jgi:GNAT superfamily N-acetyltransferase
METRPATKMDYPGIADMVSQALGEPMSPAVLMDTVYFDEDFDPNLVLISREKGVTLGLGATVIKESDGVKTGYLKLLAVQPGRQRQGLGKDLLERLEERLADEGATRLRVSACPPHHFFPGVRERQTAAIAFFEKAGYQRSAGGVQAWTAPREGQSGPFEAKPEDYARAAEFMRRHAPAWSGRLEEAFSYPVPQVVLTGAGEPMVLCLFQPGLNVGPLFWDPRVQKAPVDLLRAAAAAASGAGAADPRGIQVLDAEPLEWWSSALDLKDKEACVTFEKKLRS